MIFATFHNTFDWTAIGTLALAAITAVSLAFGFTTLRQGQREVEEAHRPVVVPLVDPRPMSLGSERGDRPGKPAMLDEFSAMVPVQNIGSGPALEVAASIDLLEPPWRSPTLPGGAIEVRVVHQRPFPLPLQAVPTPGIGVQGVFPFEFTLGPSGAALPAYKLKLTYKDVGGKIWTTSGEWVPSAGQYIGIRITGSRRRQRRLLGLLRRLRGRPSTIDIRVGR